MPLPTQQSHWKAREQESLHAAYAALRLFGVQIDMEQLRRAANDGEGIYSKLSLLDACADLFTALNHPDLNQPTSET